MSHKSKGRKNLRNQETYPLPTDVPVVVTAEEIEFADTFWMQEKQWLGLRERAHEC